MTWENSELGWGWLLPRDGTHRPPLPAVPSAPFCLWLGGSCPFHIAISDRDTPFTVVFLVTCLVRSVSIFELATPYLNTWKKNKSQLLCLFLVCLSASGKRLRLPTLMPSCLIPLFGIPSWWWWWWWYCNDTWGMNGWQSFRAHMPA